jgi:predicted RNA-binding protein with PUA-like domain
MKYWLMKSEPETYSIDDLEKEKIGVWDGVRNFQARNFMKEMRLKDQVLFYHSGKNPEIVGVMEVYKENYPDEKDESQKFVCVNVKFISKLEKAVSLQVIKTNQKLANIQLLKQSRLSVMPISKLEWDEVMRLGCST